MKKLAFILVLALCAGLCCAAQGESPYAFTQAVEQGDYTLYLPSSAQEGHGGYIVDDCAIYLYLLRKDDPSLSYTETAQERYEIFLAARESGDASQNTEIVWADECVGFVTTAQMHGDLFPFRARDVDYTRLDFFTNNRKAVLHIAIMSENAQAATALMRGILEHIVAPEMPLS